MGTSNKSSKKEQKNQDITSNSTEVDNTPPPVKPRKIIIKDYSDAKRLMNSVINAVRRDEVDLQKARTLIYALQSLLPILEKTELERRLQKLEKLLDE